MSECISGSPWPRPLSSVLEDIQRCLIIFHKCGAFGYIRHVTVTDLAFLCLSNITYDVLWYAVNCESYNLKNDPYATFAKEAIGIPRFCPKNRCYLS